MVIECKCGSIASVTGAAAAAGYWKIFNRLFADFQCATEFLLNTSPELPHKQVTQKICVFFKVFLWILFFSTIFCHKSSIIYEISPLVLLYCQLFFTFLLGLSTPLPFLQHPGRPCAAPRAATWRLPRITASPVFLRTQMSPFWTG